MGRINAIWGKNCPKLHSFGTFAGARAHHEGLRWLKPCKFQRTENQTEGRQTFYAMNQNNAYLVNSFATAGKTLVLGIGQKCLIL